MAGLVKHILWLNTVFVFRRIREIAFARHLEVMELQASLLMIIWGAWLLVPSAIHAIGSSQYWIARVMPLDVFGTVTLGAGFLKFFTLMYGTVMQRRAAMFIGVFIWLFSSIIIFEEDSYSVSAAFMLTFSMGSAIGVWRLRTTPAKAT